MTPPKRQPIKIPWAAYETLRELRRHAASYGWQSLGIDRDDTPTQTALIEEAISLLAARRKNPRGKR
jgi:hypothetical protein